jgi:hypothetical protein
MKRSTPTITNGAATDTDKATHTPVGRRVHADLLVTLDEARQLLGLPRHCLRREARLGRLQVSRRAGRLWTTGTWITAWITSGRVTRSAAPGREVQP